MSRAALLFAVVLAGVVPVWGCSQPAPPLSIASPNAAALEARIVKLERDFKAVEAARDAAVARAADYESRLKAESARSAAIQRDRDDLAATLTTRVAQAEVVQSQFDGLKKGLRDLLGTIEAASLPPAPAVTPASPALGVPLPPVNTAP